MTIRLQPTKLTGKWEGSSFVGCIAAMCISSMSAWVQPYIVAEIVGSFRTSNSRAGLIVSVELIATALSSIAFTRVARGGSSRQIALLAAFIALFGATISVASTSFGLLMLARILTGIGEGGALMVSAVVLTHMSSPDRAYAQALFINIVFGIALSLLMQMLNEFLQGWSIVFPLLLLTLIAMCPLLFLLPRTVSATRPNASSTVSGDHSISVRTTLVAVAVICVAASTNCVWSFYFALGRHAGMDTNVISRSIKYAVLTGSSGSVVAMLLGTRFGRFIPVAIALPVQTAAIVVMLGSSSTLPFNIAADFYLVGGYFAMPYYLGFAAAEDPAGRGVAIVWSVYMLAAAASPYLGGAAIDQFGLHSIAWFIASACAAAGGLFYWLDYSRRHTAGHGSR
jgi:DHA1 family inner membrane transport protein